MAASRRDFLACGAVLAATLVVVFAYRVGYDAGEARGREDARVSLDRNGSQAQATDAIQHWLRKAGPREMENRYPYVMRFPDRNCIELRFRRPTTLGGVPIYCYRANSLQLIEEHSDVE